MTAQEKILYRILDANYNRCKEALRVVEDLLRFSNAKRVLVSSLKQSRHELTQIFLKAPRSFKEILRCRDVKKDSTKAIAIQDRSKKIKVEDLLYANFQRSEEALRVLEECMKPLRPSLAAELSCLRFKIYDLEKRTSQQF